MRIDPTTTDDIERALIRDGCNRDDIRAAIGSFIDAAGTELAYDPATHLHTLTGEDLDIIRDQLDSDT